MALVISGHDRSTDYVHFDCTISSIICHSNIVRNKIVQFSKLPAACVTYPANSIYPLYWRIPHDYTRCIYCTSLLICNSAPDNHCTFYYIYPCCCVSVHVTPVMDMQKVRYSLWWNIFWTPCQEFCLESRLLCCFGNLKARVPGQPCWYIKRHVLIIVVLMTFTRKRKFAEVLSWTFNAIFQIPKLANDKALLDHED